MCGIPAIKLDIVRLIVEFILFHFIYTNIMGIDLSITIFHIKLVKSLYSSTEERNTVNILIYVQFILKA